MTARVRGVTAASTAAGSRQSVASSTSQKTGLAPARTITLAVAGQVSGVVMTSSPSPSPTPSARSARYIAAVQEETASACCASAYCGELALELPRERPGGQPAGLERVQHVRALLLAERGRSEVEPVLAAHGAAAGDGGEVDRNGHGAQDRRRLRAAGRP